MKRSRVVILAAAAALALGAPALAFHDGGVAHCNGCHTMHNSQNSAQMAKDGLGGAGPGIGQGYPDLLLFPNKTDVCLGCHNGGGSYKIWSADPTAPNATTANRGGGDFVFLGENNINDGHSGASNPILGEKAGHNVISIMRGTIADSTHTTSPGGTYSSANMHCSSCHDPHGTSAFRILYQTGQAVNNVVYTSTLNAVGIPMFGPGESNGNHNAYNSGYSDWCATCHGDFHAGSANLIHPSGENLSTLVADTYNAYEGTTDCIANPPAIDGQPCGTGLLADAYLAAVPFEDAGMTRTTTAGPTTASQVACVSCHRAHATSAPDAGRWDFNVTGLAEDGHESLSYKIPNPYDGNQRSLCNKCHSQDEFDALVDFTP